MMNTTTPEEWADAVLNVYPHNRAMVRGMIADGIRAKEPYVLSAEERARNILALLFTPENIYDDDIIAVAEYLRRE